MLTKSSFFKFHNLPKIGDIFYASNYKEVIEIRAVKIENDYSESPGESYIVTFDKGYSGYPYKDRAKCEIDFSQWLVGRREYFLHQIKENQKELDKISKIILTRAQETNQQT